MSAADKMRAETKAMSYHLLSPKIKLKSFHSACLKLFIVNSFRERRRVISRPFSHEAEISKSAETKTFVSISPPSLRN